MGQSKGSSLFLASSLMLTLNLISFERHVANVIWGCDQAGHVEVECVDESGDPVEVAEVFLFQFDGDRYQLFGPFISNMEGKIECEQELFSDDKGHYDRWIYARIKGESLGIARAVRFRNSEQVINPKHEVTLRPSRSVKGTVQVPPEFDPTKVRVHIQVLHVKSGDGMFDFDSLPRHERFPGLDTGLSEIFDCTPDAEGVFTFDDLPVNGRVYLVTHATGLGQSQWKNEGWHLEPDPELRIEKEVPVTGRVLTPDGTPASGITVGARLQAGQPMNPCHLSSFTGKTDSQGKFSISEVPHQKFTISIDAPDRKIVFHPQPDLIGDSSTGVKIELQTETPIRVAGRVVDQDNKPVKGAAISAIANPDIGFDSDQTNEAGEFNLLVPSGKVQLYFNGLPAGFEYPDPQIVKEFEVKKGQADIESVEIVLERSSEK